MAARLSVERVVEAFGRVQGDGCGQRRSVALQPALAVVVGAIDAEVVQHGDYVGDAALEPVGGRVVRLVAGAVAAGVEHDELVVVLQPIQESELLPVAPAAGQPVV